jgi:hypothetical protein
MYLLYICIGVYYHILIVLSSDALAREPSGNKTTDLIISEWTFRLLIKLKLLLLLLLVKTFHIFKVESPDPLAIKPFNGKQTKHVIIPN